MKRVIIESPCAGTPEIAARNLAYAKACLKDSLSRGEAPLASHLLYTQVLDDNVPAERRQGIGAGQEWIAGAETVVVYENYGISSGMRYGIMLAEDLGVPVEYRRLEGYET